MPEDLLDRGGVHAGHGGPAAIGVPEVVPVEVLQTGEAADPGPAMLEAGEGSTPFHKEIAPVLRRAGVKLLADGSQGGGGEREVSFEAAFGVGQGKEPGFKVDIPYPDVEELPFSEPCVDAEDDHMLELTVQGFVFIGAPDGARASQKEVLVFFAAKVALAVVVDLVAFDGRYGVGFRVSPADAIFEDAGEGAEV